MRHHVAEFSRTPPLRHKRIGTFFEIEIAVPRYDPLTSEIYDAYPDDAPQNDAFFETEIITSKCDPSISGIHAWQPDGASPDNASLETEIATSRCVSLRFHDAFSRCLFQRNRPRLSTRIGACSLLSAFVITR